MVQLVGIDGFLMLSLSSSDGIAFVQEIVSVSHHTGNVPRTSRLHIDSYLTVVLHLSVHHLNFALSMVVHRLVDPLVVKSVHLGFYLKFKISMFWEK